ncbi:hypothetical protein [Archangium sp. Cb G35]|nr:hypothetical protein [Archangium sp. Cb G35]
MNEQKKQPKKLSLNKETLRNITAQGQQMKAPYTSPRCSDYSCPSDDCA